MPHVVIDKRIDLESFSKNFEETVIKKSCLIKLLDVFLDSEKKQP